MFKQRLLTTVVALPLVLLALYYSNLTAFIGITTVLTLACGFEWRQLIPLTTASQSFVFLSILFICLGSLLLPVFDLYFHEYRALAFLPWFLIALALLFFPQSQTVWGHHYLIAVFAILLLALYAKSFIQIYQMPQGKVLILYLLALVWGADIGAYLMGKAWGRHALIPAVSPGKTIEGLFGGALLSALVALGAYLYLYQYPPHPGAPHLIPWLLMAGLVFIMALIGDLLISMLKRRVHLKDTGTLFPGHGGFLDRLDSLIAATPAFYALILTLPRGA